MKVFTGFGAFARHLIVLAAEAELVTYHATDTAGAIILKDAKARIGYYQAAVGPYPAWAPLAASTEAAKARMGAPPNAPLLATGEMYASMDKTMESIDKTVIGATDEKMIYHELGTSKMPARPVFGPAAFTSRERIELGCGAIVAAWIAGVGWKRPRLPGLTQKSGDQPGEHAG